MKTVFKVGMKAYDQIFYPDEEGEVKKVYQDCIKVVFGGIEMSYSLDGRTTLYKEKPTLSTKPYKVQIEGFEQKESSPNFYDVYDRFSHVFSSIDYEEDYHGYPTQELADAAEALRRLLFLRDYYNEGWQPDWTKATVKYCIEVYGEDLSIIDFQFKLKPMAFKNREIRDKFLEEQRELLEIAKPLL